ncbi:CpsD/CapB family tyrosine-protein kinase [Falsirhodobacter sp. 20TX0035]|uniref:CpsD/CapB family tyrosine-protein kinase n=1 Tax=Falsirhodobacter sp. 20TX0035 TaxID=3022019 RepID=UPI00232D3C93|nr:CpsD/CapB family tyrosine-protein kinase [Falsirhodobacter sp. 20TX0035]MDB6452956.1 CpsD/CapB family tyrosine-protein kinase [Falsirhodobacter sp. 20TX0035]
MDGSLDALARLRDLQGTAEMDPRNLLWSQLPDLERKVDRQVLTEARVFTLVGTREAAPYDLLRTKVLQLCRTNGWKRLAVVSASPAEGKSLTSLNLAFSMARQSELRIMLYDADLRRPACAPRVGLPEAGNLGSVLRHEVPFEDHAVRFGDNLILALNGRPQAAASELLQSTRTETLITAVEAAYRPDVTVFDMPPLGAADDTHGFLRHVDAALIVIAAEETPLKKLDIIERQVAALTNVAGIVLNKCKYADDLYGMDYGYY